MMKQQHSATLFSSASGSGNELDTNLEKDSEKDVDDSRCEKEGNDIDTGQRIEEETADEASRADSDPYSWSESEHDDSVLDEDYRPKKDDRPDDDSDADTAQDSEKEAALEAPAVKRHKRPRSHVEATGDKREAP